MGSSWLLLGSWGAPCWNTEHIDEHVSRERQSGTSTGVSTSTLRRTVKVGSLVTWCTWNKLCMPSDDMFCHFMLFWLNVFLTQGAVFHKMAGHRNWGRCSCSLVILRVVFKYVTFFLCFVNRLHSLNISLHYIWRWKSVKTEYLYVTEVLTNPPLNLRHVSKIISQYTDIVSIISVLNFTYKCTMILYAYGLFRVIM